MTHRLLGTLLLFALACGDDSADPDASEAGTSDVPADVAPDDTQESDVEEDVVSDDVADDISDDVAADVAMDARVPMGCEGVDALFCEDFEDLAAGEASSPRWENQTNGTLTIDGAQARGAQALHVHTTLNGYGFIRIPFTPPGNSYFGRMYVYVTEFPSAPNWAHYTLVEATGDTSQRIRPVGGQFAPAGGDRPAGAYWGIGADGGPTGDWTNWRVSAPSEGGRWTCIEWEMDDSSDFIRLSIDGEDNDELTVDNGDHGGNDVPLDFPNYDQIRIGWQLYQGGSTPGEFDVWVDDIVFSSERVGCD